MIYTLGHSTLTIPVFLALSEPVQTIIDVRSHPGSVHPQFNKEEMELWLNGKKNYEWEPRLGGWRDVYASYADELAKHGVNVLAYCQKKFPKGQIAAAMPETDSPSWTNRGLFEYAWFMIIDDFLIAADNIIQRGKTEDLALICCEVHWWRCHRSMISDYLWYRGVESIHLMPYTTKSRGFEIKRTAHSSVISNRLERYDQHIIQRWDNWVRK